MIYEEIEKYLITYGFKVVQEDKYMFEKNSRYLKGAYYSVNLRDFSCNLVFTLASISEVEQLDMLKREYKLIIKDIDYLKRNNHE